MRSPLCAAVGSETIAPTTSSASTKATPHQPPRPPTGVARGRVAWTPESSMRWLLSLACCRWRSGKRDHAAGDATRLHIVEGLVDRGERQALGHQFVRLQPPLPVPGEVARHGDAEARPAQCDL